MRRLSRGMWLALASIVLTACGGSDPVSPTAPAPPTNPPTSTRTLVSLAVGGPEFGPAVYPGDIVQWTASATWSDGTTENVTDRVNWETSNFEVASVHAGRVSVNASGEAIILARLTTPSAREATRRLLVTLLPPHTVSGVVRDGARDDGRPIDTALVEIVNARGVRSVFSDGSGYFSVADARGPVRLRVSHLGYDTFERDLGEPASDMRQDVFLVRTKSPAPGSLVDTTFVDQFDADPNGTASVDKRYVFVTGAAGAFEARVERLGCDYNSYYAIGAQLVSGSRIVDPGTSQSLCVSTIAVDVPAGRYELVVRGSRLTSGFQVTVRYRG